MKKFAAPLLAVAATSISLGAAAAQAIASQALSGPQAGFGGLLPPELWAAKEEPLRGPGPGHPERLVPDVLPTAVEAQLWSRLIDV